MSPVWIMKAGFAGQALMRSTASLSVASASGLAGLSKPTWLSLICRNVKGCVGLPAACAWLKAQRRAAGRSHAPENAGSGPSHALEEPAPVDAIGIVRGSWRMCCCSWCSRVRGVALDAPHRTRPPKDLFYSETRDTIMFHRTG